jgi:integrase
MSRVRVSSPAPVLAGFTLPEPSAIGRKNWIRSKEISEILDATGHDQDLKFALFCGFDAGLRRNEVSEARVDWFDLENGLLHVSNNGDFVTKDRDNRTIPLTNRFAEFLKGYLAGRDSSQYVLAAEKAGSSTPNESNLYPWSFHGKTWGTFVFKRYATFDEITHAVLFLAHPYASFITGSTGTVDGG